MLVPMLLPVIEVHGGSTITVQGVMLKPLLAIRRYYGRLSAVPVTLTILKPLFSLKRTSGVFDGRQIVISVADPVFVPGMKTVVVNDVRNAFRGNSRRVPIGVSLDGVNAVYGSLIWSRHMKKIAPLEDVQAAEDHQALLNEGAGIRHLRCLLVLILWQLAQTTSHLAISASIAVLLDSLAFLLAKVDTIEKFLSRVSMVKIHGFR